MSFRTARLARPAVLLANTLAATLALLTPSASAGGWMLERLDPPPLPVGETVRPASPPDGLPDGGIARNGGNGDIVAAWYAAPTTRYGHAVLGDAIEAGRLVVETRRGDRLSLTLPETEVFEDRTPRLVDLDGDGTTEVVTIRSSLSAGASVTVYAISGGRLVEKASTGFIGRANRWLNIAGIGDFLGNGFRQIAHVRTPHIGGTLIVHAYENGAVVELARLAGFSNHAIGSRELNLSAVADIDGNGRMSLALPSDNRRTLRMVSLVDGKLEERAAIKLPSAIDKAIGTHGSGLTASFTVGLSDGSHYRVQR